MNYWDYWDNEKGKRQQLENGGTCVIDHAGSKFWYDEKGEYHREEGPSIEYADDGSKTYWIHG